MIMPRENNSYKGKIKNAGFLLIGEKIPCNLATSNFNLYIEFW